MANRFSELSGWILPDGTWMQVAEWWHIQAIYELRDSGNLSDPDLATVLQGGDEALIRHELAAKGFAKVSRGVLDAYSMTDAQLRSLQDQLMFFDASDEVLILMEGGVEKRVSLERVLKLRKPHSLFVGPGS